MYLQRRDGMAMECQLGPKPPLQTHCIDRYLEGIHRYDGPTVDVSVVMWNRHGGKVVIKFCGHNILCCGTFYVA